MQYHSVWRTRPAECCFHICQVYNLYCEVFHYIHLDSEMYMSLFLQDSYLAKVEHLAKIREKQEEDKASVKLHSFKCVFGSCWKTFVVDLHNFFLFFSNFLLLFFVCWWKFSRDKENTGALSSGNVETLKYLESSHPVKVCLSNHSCRLNALWCYADPWLNSVISFMFA